MPLSITETLKDVIEHCVKWEYEWHRRRFMNNERFIALTDHTDLIKKRIRCVLNESRAQGLHTKEVIESMEQKLTDVLEAKIEGMNTAKAEQQTNMETLFE